MQVHVEMPHTKISMEGEIPTFILEALKREYGRELKIEDEEKESVNPFETTWYKDQKSKVPPPRALKLLRENRSLTQTALGRAIGVPNNRISEYERGIRSISKEVAKKLAKELGTSVEHFI